MKWSRSRIHNLKVESVEVTASQLDEKTDRAEPHSLLKVLTGNNNG